MNIEFSVGNTTLCQGMPVIMAVKPHPQHSNCVLEDTQLEKVRLLLSGLDLRECMTLYDEGMVVEVDTSRWPAGEHTLQLQIGERFIEYSEAVWILGEEEYLRFWKDVHSEPFDDSIRANPFEIQDLANALISNYPILVQNSRRYRQPFNRVEFQIESAIIVPSGFSRSRVSFAIDALLADIAYIAPYFKSLPDLAPPWDAYTEKIDLVIGLGGVEITTKFQLVRPPSSRVVDSLAEQSNLAQLRRFGHGEFQTEVIASTDDIEVRFRVYIESELAKGLDFSSYISSEPGSSATASA